MPKRLASAALLLFCGCDVSSNLFLPLPDVDASSALLSFRSLEEEPLHVIEAVEKDLPLRPGSFNNESFSVEALFFAETLAELDVGAGPIETAPAPHRPLPPSLVEVRADIEEGKTDGWTPMEARPPDLVDFRLAGIFADCDPVSFEVVDVGSNSAVRSVVEVDSETLLVTAGRDVMLVTEAGVTPLTADFTTTSTQEPRTGVRTSDGRFWFSQSNRITSARLNGTTMTVEESWPSPEDRIERILVTDPDLPELYGMSLWGGIIRFDGTTWTEAGRVCSDCSSGSIGIFKTEDARILFHHGNGFLGILDGDDFQVLTVPLDTTDNPAGGGYIPGLGFVAGSKLGAFNVLENGSWRRLGTTEEPLRTTTILPITGGFVANSSPGWVTIYRIAEEWLCPSAETLPGRITAAARWGDAWAIGVAPVRGQFVIMRER